VGWDRHKLLCDVTGQTNISHGQSWISMGSGVEVGGSWGLLAAFCGWW